MHVHTRSPSAASAPAELHPLTDSLASRIRWRFCDYEAMLRAEVALMLDSAEQGDGPRARSGTGRR